MVVDVLSRRLHARFRHQPGCLVARKEHAGRPLVLVKPLRYMNESGVVVKEQLTREPDEFLAVCDDLALPFGRLRLRPKGSDGGHKGLGSIIYHLGRTDFARLRIGIDAPGPGEDGIDYVLNDFPSEQAARLPEVLDRAADACLTVVTGGLELAMNRFNPSLDAESSESSGVERPVS